MKVLLINGSPNADGNTFIALSEVAKTLNADGIETEIVQLGKKPVPGYINCNRCRETGVCIFNICIYQEAFEMIQSTIVPLTVYDSDGNCRRNSDGVRPVTRLNVRVKCAG